MQEKIDNAFESSTDHTQYYPDAYLSCELRNHLLPAAKDELSKCIAETVAQVLACFYREAEEFLKHLRKTGAGKESLQFEAEWIAVVVRGVYMGRRIDNLLSDGRQIQYQIQLARRIWLQFKNIIECWHGAKNDPLLAKTFDVLRVKETDIM